MTDGGSRFSPGMSVPSMAPSMARSSAFGPDFNQNCIPDPGFPSPRLQFCGGGAGGFAGC